MSLNVVFSFGPNIDLAQRFVGFEAEGRFRPAESCAWPTTLRQPTIRALSANSQQGYASRPIRLILPMAAGGIKPEG